MRSLLHHVGVLFALFTSLAVAWASESPIQGLLTFKDLNRAVSSRGNSSANSPELFSLLATREARHPLISGRQEEECPPGYPIPCPSGVHCTTTDQMVCCADGVHTCETGASCCNGGTHCTPVGGFCCGETACDEGDKCCPSGCGPPGSTCCGSTYYCNAGESCCGNGCADVGSTCCGTNHQCTPDEQCCPGGNNGCAPKSATCCGPEHYCDKGALCCVDNDKDYFCSPGPNCIDTLPLDLNDYPGMDEIFENMCRGILQSGLSPNKVNEIILTYIGKGEQPIANQNRRDAGCTGSPCAKIFSGPGPNGAKLRFSCDEFPFATSEEGGAIAAILCVPQRDNSAIGSRWGRAVRGKAKGTKIRVKIKNFDCSTVSIDKRSTEVGETTPKALMRRTGAVMKNDTNAIYIDGSVYGNYSDGKVAMIIPLDIPDDFVGTFSVDYTIASGILKSGSIMDDWGEEYGPISISRSGQSATGTVDVGPDGVGNVMILAWADDTEVALNYTTSLTTSTAAPTPMETGSTFPGTTIVSVTPSGLSSTKVSAANRRQGSGLLFRIAAGLLHFF